MERVYFVCAGHFTGILLGLLYIRWRGYILCVQAFWWVCCLSDGEGIFCVCRSLHRHTAGFVVYQMERVYSVCAGHFTGILLGLLFIWWRGYILCVQVTSQAYCWVCCISDGEGIFCVCRSFCRHTAGFAVYLTKRVYFVWAGMTERVYFVCAGILLGLLYIWQRGYILCVQAFWWVSWIFVCAGHLAGILVGLLYMWQRGYILCVQVTWQAFWWVCCICDREGIFCVCRSLGRHSGGFVIYDNMWWRGYVLCVQVTWQAFWWVCCICDGAGIFCVFRSFGRHTGGFAVYQGTPETSDGQLYTPSFRFVFTFTLFTASRYMTVEPLFELSQDSRVSALLFSVDRLWAGYFVFYLCTIMKPTIWHTVGTFRSCY